MHFRVCRRSNPLSSSCDMTLSLFGEGRRSKEETQGVRGLFQDAAKKKA
jgi:hypothetical protein